jgi:hypothetical protein
MKTKSGWKNRQKCNSLSVEEADKLFFPPVGGKKNAADKFCADCPVRSLCLQEAIDSKAYGNWAGTTERERTKFRVRNPEFARLLASLMPDPESEVGKRKIYLKVVTTPEFHTWIDTVEGPSDDDLLRLSNGGNGLTPHHQISA